MNKQDFTYTILYIVIFLALSSIAILIFIVMSRKKIIKNELEKKDLEIKLTKEKFEIERLKIKSESNAKIVENELKNAKEKLNNLILNIREKNKIIEQLQSKKIKENDTIIFNLKQSTILTEEHWKSFQQDFTKVFPDLVNDLRIRYCEITPAEIRLICLSKLNFSYKEIAKAQGISTETVRSTWHRFKKKYPSLKEETLEQLTQKM